MRSDWILLRGLGREAGHWRDFPQRLERALPGARAVCLDLPGAGEFYQEGCPFGVPAIVDFLEEKARLKEVSFPTYILGISLGGMIALEWLRRSPSQFVGGVLINSSIGGLSPLYERLKPGAWSMIAKTPLTKDTLEREERILNSVSHNRALRRELLHEWLEIAEARPISAKTLGVQIASAAMYRPILERSTVPLLFLVSRYDQLASPSCSYKLREKLGGDLLEHPTAGHELSIDDPQWVVDSILSWTRKNETPTTK